MFAPIRARLSLGIAIAIGSGCSAPPAPPPAIEAVDERRDAPRDATRDEAVVVEGDLPTPTSEASATPGQAAPVQPGFALPPDFRADAISGAGDELFYVGSRFGRDQAHVARLTRSGEKLAHSGPVGGQIHVLGQKGKTAAVVTGGHGGFAVYESGAWTYRLAPALEAEATASAVRTSDGRFLVVGREHALYELAGDDWKTHRYPSSGNAFTVAALASDGTLFLLGTHGRVVTFKNGSFADLKIAGLGTGPFQGTWVDEARGEVWLAAPKALVKVSLSGKTATMVPSPLFFDVEGIGGAVTAKGTLVVACSFGKVALFDGKDWSQVSDSGADTVYLDAARAQVYALRSGSVSVHGVQHAWLGTGVHTPMTR